MYNIILYYSRLVSLLSTAQWSRANATTDVPNFSISDVGLSDLSSDTEPDRSLGPGPSKTQSTSKCIEYCDSGDMIHDEELKLTSDEDQSLSEVRSSTQRCYIIHCINALHVTIFFTG